MKTIYYLFEIGENIPRYVGVTKQELRVRLNSHKCSKGNVKREVWIRDAQTRLGIGIKELERCEDNIAIEREIFWTNELSKDYDLCNLRIGNGTSKELSKILSYGQKNKKEINWAALRITHEKARGQKRNKDFCDKLSLRFKGVPKSKEAVEKMKQRLRMSNPKKVYVNGVLYDCIMDASDASGISREVISKVINGTIKKTKFDIKPFTH